MVPSLSTMPAEILDMIFDDIDFVAIQKVRKVCRHLRNHIDHFPPDSKLNSVMMYEYEHRNQMVMKFVMENNQTLEVKYYDNGKNGCRIFFENRLKHLDNQDFASLIGNDLGLILRNQNSEATHIRLVFPLSIKLRLSENCLETFHGRFLAALVPHLESRRTSIQIKNIEVFEISQESQIMKILRFLDPGCLDSILIRFSKQRGFSSPTMKINNLIGLEQWKQAKHISIHGLNLASNIENFSHLERMDIELKQISGEELVTLRETIIHRPSFFDEFIIYYRHLKDPLPFTSVFGEPRSWEYTAWFNIPNNNENALRIRWHPKLKWFVFECRKRMIAAHGTVFN
ncbi:unnamed protein product [Caenorhabditis brenneri]